jgi:hypothetical protein
VLRFTVFRYRITWRKVSLSILSLAASMVIKQGRQGLDTRGVSQRNYSINGNTNSTFKGYKEINPENP